MAFHPQSKDVLLTASGQLELSFLPPSSLLLLELTSSALCTELSPFCWLLLSEDHSLRLHSISNLQRPLSAIVGLPSEVASIVFADPSAELVEGEGWGNVWFACGQDVSRHVFVLLSRVCGPLGKGKGADQLRPLLSSTSRSGPPRQPRPYSLPPDLRYSSRSLDILGWRRYQRSDSQRRWQHLGLVRRRGKNGSW